VLCGVAALTTAVAVVRQYQVQALSYVLVALGTVLIGSFVAAQMFATRLANNNRPRTTSAYAEIAVRSVLIAGVVCAIALIAINHRPSE